MTRSIISLMFVSVLAWRAAFAFAVDNYADDNAVANSKTSETQSSSDSVKLRPLFFTRPASELEANAANVERLDDDMTEFPLVDSAERENESVNVGSCSRWARFPVGSWARSRTTSVTYEKKRPVQSVTETTITLKDVDLENKNYTLECESTIKLGSVDYSRRVETVQYDFWDVPLADVVDDETLAPVSLMIGSRAIPCLTRRVTRKNAKYTETTTLWYSYVSAPYVLQRETVHEAKNDASRANSSVSSRSLYVVQKVASPFAQNIAPQSYLARSSFSANNRDQTTTLIFSPAIPGGILRQTMLETRSANDPAVCQTTTILLDYYIAL